MAIPSLVSSSSRRSLKHLIQNHIHRRCDLYNASGMMTVSTLRRHEKNELQDVDCIKNGNVEPLVAFDKPRMPPVLGPLLIFSLLEMSSSNRDDK